MFGWGSGCFCCILSNIFTFGFSISGFGILMFVCGCGSGCLGSTGISTCGLFICCLLFTAAILFLKSLKNEGCAFSFWLLRFISVFLFISLSLSLKKANLGFSLAGSFLSSSLMIDFLGFSSAGATLSSSLKKSILVFRLGCSSFILISPPPPKSLNISILGFSFSTFSTFILIFASLIFFSGSLISLSSSKNDFLFVASIFFGSSSNKVILDFFKLLFSTFGGFCSWFWFCWLMLFNFLVISSVLPKILSVLISSLSSSSSSPNKFFNLSLAFSKFLFLISIFFVSSWNIPYWGCGFGIWGCGWFICTWGNWACISGCWSGICCCGWILLSSSWLCFWLDGLGIPIIIIGWALWLNFELFSFSLFWSGIWGFPCWIVLLIGNWIGFLLWKRGVKSSSSSSSSPPKIFAPPKKFFIWILSLFTTASLFFITGAKGFLLSASVFIKYETEVGSLLLLLLASTLAIILFSFPLAFIIRFRSISLKSCGLLFISVFNWGFAGFTCSILSLGFAGSTCSFLALGFACWTGLFNTGGGGGGGGGGGIAPPDFAGSAAITAMFS